jgi:hypothetical protein
MPSIAGCACNAPANTCDSATTCANTGGCAADFYQTADETRIHASGQECTAASDWKNIQGQDSSVERCASECSAHAYFTMASGQGGDRNCKCCTDSPGPGSLQAASSMDTYLNAAHSSFISTNSAVARCAACPNGKTQTAQAFTADPSGSNRYCTLKPGFSGAGDFAGRAAAAALAPALGTPTPTSDGFTAQISNYDAPGYFFTWASTVTGSGSVAISGSGQWPGDCDGRPGNNGVVGDNHTRARIMAAVRAP